MFHFIFMVFYPVCFFLVARLFNDKDRELIILRQQILILKRQLGRKTISIAPERLAMLIFGHRLPDFKKAILILKPETVLSWHRKLARRRWTYFGQKPGRPNKSKEIRNISFGYQRKIQSGDMARFREK